MQIIQVDQKFVYHRPIKVGDRLHATVEIISIEHYGESADDKTLFREFGFTAENVVAQTKAALARRADVFHRRGRRVGMDVVG